jgi:hypothetical protein
MQTEKDNSKPGWTQVPEIAKTMEAQVPGPGLLKTRAHMYVVSLCTVIV